MSASADWIDDDDDCSGVGSSEQQSAVSSSTAFASARLPDRLVAMQSTDHSGLDAEAADLKALGDEQLDLSAQPSRVSESLAFGDLKHLSPLYDDGPHDDDQHVQLQQLIDRRKRQSRAVVTKLRQQMKGKDRELAKAGFSLLDTCDLLEDAEDDIGGVQHQLAMGKRYAVLGASIIVAETRRRNLLSLRRLCRVVHDLSRRIDGVNDCLARARYSQALALCRQPTCADADAADSSSSSVFEKLHTFQHLKQVWGELTKNDQCVRTAVTTSLSRMITRGFSSTRCDSVSNACVDLFRGDWTEASLLITTTCQEGVEAALTSFCKEFFHPEDESDVRARTAWRVEIAAVEQRKLLACVNGVCRTLATVLFNSCRVDAWVSRDATRPICTALVVANSVVECLTEVVQTIPLRMQPLEASLSCLNALHTCYQLAGVATGGKIAGMESSAAFDQALASACTGRVKGEAHSKNIDSYVAVLERDPLSPYPVTEIDFPHATHADMTVADERSQRLTSYIQLARDLEAAVEDDGDVDLDDDRSNAQYDAESVEVGSYQSGGYLTSPQKQSARSTPRSTRRATSAVRFQTAPANPLDDTSLAEAPLHFTGRAELATSPTATFTISSADACRRILDLQRKVELFPPMALDALSVAADYTAIYVTFIASNLYGTDILAPENDQNIPLIHRQFLRVIKDVSLRSMSDESKYVFPSFSPHALCQMWRARAQSSQNWYACMERTNGIHSVEHVLNCYRTIVKTLSPLVPAERLKHHCDFIDKTVNCTLQFTVSSMRRLSFSILAAETVIGSIEKSTNWDGGFPMGPSSFAEAVVNNLWELQKGMRDLHEGLPAISAQRVYCFVVFNVYHGVVEGFSRVRRVSEGGRQQMSVDAFHLTKKIRDTLAVRGLPSADFLLKFIKALGSPNDLVGFVVEHHQWYTSRQIMFLASNADLALEKKGLLTAEVEGLLKRLNHEDKPTPMHLLADYTRPSELMADFLASWEEKQRSNDSYDAKSATDAVLKVSAAHRKSFYGVRSASPTELQQATSLGSDVQQVLSMSDADALSNDEQDV